MAGVLVRYGGLFDGESTFAVSDGCGPHPILIEGNTMDAILFSAKPSMVDVDDAIRHLADHKELYWEVGFQIVKEKLSFPILGFIHISGGQVEYRVTINDILPFDPAHYENAALAERVKPEPWRREWKENFKGIRSYPWKKTLVIARIDPFSCETKAFKKYDGGSIKLAPRSYVRVFPPEHELPPPKPPRKPVPEKVLEAVVMHYLEEIEPGLKLEERQLATPAGRLDLLCRDADGTYVVVEIKKSQGTDQVVGQVLRYMGWVIDAKATDNVRGIIIVQSKDRRLSYAIKAAPNVQIKEYRMMFA